MNTSNNTILITGGSAGIGFEMAKLFAESGNKVIITGRNSDRLRQASKQLNGVTAIESDVTSDPDVNYLVEKLTRDHKDLNIVINNAGQAYLHNPAVDENAFTNAQDEMLTNYLSVIRLNQKLLPLISANSNAAIVNVSSIVAFVPGALATYSASKAALHSYTQWLRLNLSGTEVRVFELMPPLVNTTFSKEIGGANGIAPDLVAKQLIEAMIADEFEIHVGQTAELYKLFLSSPTEALKAMNNRLNTTVAESN